jgi:hypothetical protein
VHDEGSACLEFAGATDGVVTAKSEALGPWLEARPRTFGAARDREGHGEARRGPLEPTLASSGGQGGLEMATVTAMEFGSNPLLPVTAS